MIWNEKTKYGLKKVKGIFIHLWFRTIMKIKYFQSITLSFFNVIFAFHVMSLTFNFLIKFFFFTILMVYFWFNLKYFALKSAY